MAGGILVCLETPFILERVKVLVCGSRTWPAYHCVRKRLAELPEGSTIIHGGARGADLHAAIAARALGIPERVFPAQWRKHGRKAGFIRNLEMLEAWPDRVLAFWDGTSPGTAHTIREAEKRGIPVERILFSDI